MRLARKDGLAAIAVTALVACSSPAAIPEPAPAASGSEPPEPFSVHAATPRARPQLDGRAFPDHVLALTWDDGPDVGTLRLAEYLASRHVSATFFVVDEWAGDLSEEPGRGAHEFETGYAYIPILGDLVALGHRLGNHTANHVLLAAQKPALVDFELRENQRQIDPFLTNELRVFRSPGGAWDDDASAALLQDPELFGMVGPVRWDIDRKDWESSLYCRSDRPRLECEPAAPVALAGGKGSAPRSRVRAEVTASRYLDSVRQAGHGIVLFHDRVGDVGSDYALRVARQVIPALEARGFVFAAPVLELGALRSRAGEALTAEFLASLDPSTITFEDVDGDGRADLCGQGTGGSGCAHSVERAGLLADTMPETVFTWNASSNAGVKPAPSAVVSASVSGAPSARASRVLRGDLNGDGRIDECRVTVAGLSCALSGPHGLLGESLWLARSRQDAGTWLDDTTRRFALADINGDGRADLCAWGADDDVPERDVACALAP